MAGNLFHVEQAATVRPPASARRGFLAAPGGCTTGRRRGVAWLAGRRGPAFFCRGSGLAFLELEADLAIGTAYEVGRELATCAGGHKVSEEVSPTAAEKLLHLLGFHGLLQNHLARTEVAGLGAAL